MKPEHASAYAWGALGCFVGGWDYLAPKGQTLSEGVDFALEKHPVVTIAAVGAVALHLLNLLPPEIDIIHQLGRLKRNG